MNVEALLTIAIIVLLLTNRVGWGLFLMFLWWVVT